VGFQGKPCAVIALHICRKSDSQIFTFETTENFIYLAIKGYKELWDVEDRVQSEHPKSVRAEAAIKTVLEQTRRNPLWKHKIMSQEVNISTHSSHASSGTIYT
jgi:hypothetical protein